MIKTKYSKQTRLPEKLNVVIVGHGKASQEITRLAKEEGLINILAVVGAKGKSYKRFFKNKDLYGIIDATDDPKVFKSLAQEKPDRLAIMPGSCLKTMWQLVHKSRDSAEELRKIISRVVERSPAIVVIIDTKGKVEYVNNNFVQLSGYSAKEAIGSDVRRFYQQAEDEAKRMWHTLKLGQEWKGELLNKKKNGQPFWEFASISTLKDPKGKITHFLKMGTDITEHKMTQQALLDSEERYRLISEGAFNFISILTLEGVFEYANPAHRILGYTPEELKGKSGLDMVHPEDRPQLQALLEKYAQAKDRQALKKEGGYFEQFEFRFPDNAGRWHDIEATANLVKNRLGQERIILIGRDITARKQAEEVLEAAYKMNRRIIEHVPLGVYVVTTQGDIDYVNPAMLKICGETYEQFLYANVFEQAAVKGIGLDDKIRAGLQGQFFQIEAAEYKSAYNQKTNILNFVGIPLEERGAKKVLVIAEDISEHKKIESELKKVNEELKKLDQMKTEFISTTSHEFRSPLTAVRESVSQVLDGILGTLGDQQREYLAIALENIDRLWKIVNDLLDISKIESGRIEMRRTLVNICETVKNAASGYQVLLAHKKIALEYRLPKESVDIFIDTEKIIRVLSNLLSNAYKFTNHGGRITISVEDKEDDVEVTVEDTGVGIAQADLPRLFNKFAQFGHIPKSREKGTGLGLAISKGLIEMHNGRIWAQSKLHQGSTFRFSIPRVDSRIIFREYIDQGMREAMEREAGFSLIVLKIENYKDLDTILTKPSAGDILTGLEKEVRKVLRRNADVFLRDTGECVILLYGTELQGGLVARNKVAEVVKQYISDIQSRHKIQVQVSTGISAFPEEAASTEELLLKAHVKLKGMYLGKERRRHERIEHSISVNFAQEQEREAQGELQSVDISEGGICISTFQKMNEDDDDELVLNLPEGFGTVKVKTKVQWVRKVGEGGEYRVGLKFSEISKEDKQALKRFFESGGR